MSHITAQRNQREQQKNSVNRERDSSKKALCRVEEKERSPHEDTFCCSLFVFSIVFFNNNISVCTS